MTGPREALRRKQLDIQIRPLREVGKLPQPLGGWIRAIRESLGMSLEDFARRLNLASSSTAFQLEKSEVEESISIKRLRAAADALGCDLVVAVVPRVPLEQFVRQQARRKASETLQRVNHTMEMESQAINSPDQETLLEHAAEEILRRGGSQLWK